MMKKTLFILAALLLLGAPVIVTAQIAKEAKAESIVYYTPKQESRGPQSIWVDDIEFGPVWTVVTLHYLRASGGANLLPSTKLICHLRGGKTKVLDLQHARGISTQKDQYTQLGRGEVFRAYFSPLDPADIAKMKIKSVDFMEDPSRKSGGNVFNITDIKLDRKHQVLR